MVLARLVTDKVSGLETQGVLADAANAERLRHADAIAAAVQKAVQGVLATLRPGGEGEEEAEDEPEAEEDDGTTRAPVFAPDGTPIITTRPPRRHLLTPRRRRVATTTLPPPGVATTVSLHAPNTTRSRQAANAAHQLASQQNLLNAVSWVAQPNASNVAPPSLVRSDPLMDYARGMGASLVNRERERNAAEKAAEEARAVAEKAVAEFARLPHIPVGAVLELKSIQHPTTSLRHCSDQVYVTAKHSSDTTQFRFKVVEALNGQPRAVSFQSIDNPYRFVRGSPVCVCVSVCVSRVCVCVCVCVCRSIVWYPLALWCVPVPALLPLLSVSSVVVFVGVVVALTHSLVHSPPTHSLPTPTETGT